ncbi:hypothetical protein ACTQ5J_13085 [Fundicoccus sp. Sow4_F4]|uniref:hypothetical protein n=1 Tax=Fundicoccus sp. Sow4_F4 TaxID=3438783 RepID=UPI003F909869
MENEGKEFLIELQKKYNVFEDDTYSSLVNFQKNSDIPFQRWYPYREGYSYELVDKLIKRFSISGNLLDPFMGSGSSILAGRYNNLKTFGIDVNPISVFVAKVENYTLEESEIHRALGYKNSFENLRRDKQTRYSTFLLAEKYFNSDILQALLQLKDEINLIKESKVRDLLFLSWLSVIELVSNVKKEGNGLKYKNRKRQKNTYTTIPIEEWEEANFPTDKFEFVKEKILVNLSMILEDLLLYKIKAPEPTIILGSSIDKVTEIPAEIELTVFSPPYANFFDYFEIHKMELWLGDFVESQEELRILKRTGMRSNPSAVNSKSLHYNNDSVNFLINLISQKKLWSKRIPDVVLGYFDDMEILLNNLFIKTKSGGRVAIVVGNSAYNGVVVPSDLLIAEIGEKIGFVVEEIIITRHLTSSSQQRKHLIDVMDFMRESIVILRKR